MITIAMFVITVSAFVFAVMGLRNEARRLDMQEKELEKKMWSRAEEYK